MLKEVICLKRKGSLNLSINAIVVLIMAITMLGLDLGFIKNMFGGTAGQLDNMVQGLDESIKNQLSESMDRVSLAATSFDAPKGEDTNKFFAVRNDLEADPNEDSRKTFTLGDGGKITSIYCDQAIDMNADPSKVSFKTFETVTLDKGESKVLPLQIKPLSSAVSTVYSCHIMICMPDEAVSDGSCEETYEVLDFDLTVK